MATKIDAKHAIKTGRVQEGIRYWCALFDYDAEKHDELTLKRGTQVEVLTQDPKVSGSDGWWTGKVDDKVGVFPSNFVAENRLPENRLPENRLSEIRLPEIKYEELTLGNVIGKLVV